MFLLNATYRMTVTCSEFLTDEAQTPLELDVKIY